MANQPQLPELDYEAMPAEGLAATFLDASPGASRSPAPSRRRSRCCSTCCSSSSRRPASSRSTRTCSSPRPTPSGARSSGATTLAGVYEGPSLGRQARRTATVVEEQSDALLLDPQGRAARARALRPRRLDHRPAPRPVADARRRAEGRLGRGPRAVEGEPAGRLGRRALLGLHPRARAALQRAARHGYSSIGCTHCTLPGAGARAAGPGKPRRSAGCTSLVRVPAERA